MTVSGPGFDRTLQTEIRPSVIGGATIGYDFVNSGFGGYNYPSWMQYFSFAMDITYNRLCIQDLGPGIGSFFSDNSRLNGWEMAWTFMFVFHYGFVRDDVAPRGRINPYIGIGPAIVWTGVEGTLPTNKNSFTSRFGDNAVNVALVVEPGVRFVCFKNVSVDVAMRYRYSAPSWDANNVTIKTNALHQFALLIRANHHF